MLDQNKPYLILASSHQAGKIYAYCAIALGKGISEIDVKLACTLIMDIHGNLHTITSRIIWYTSSELRERAEARITPIFEEGVQGGFKNCTDPFIKINS